MEKRLADEGAFCPFPEKEKTENEFQKEFSVPLIEIDSELLAIPEIDYDICLNINSKSLSTILFPFLVTFIMMIMIIRSYSFKYKISG